MQTRRKTGRQFQLEPMEGRVSLSGIGPVTCGSNSIRMGQETNAVVVPYGSNGKNTFGQETNAVVVPDGSDGKHTFGQETNAVVVPDGSNTIRAGQEGNAVVVAYGSNDAS